MKEERKKRKEREKNKMKGKKRKEYQEKRMGGMDEEKERGRQERKEGTKETFYIMTRTSWELKVNSSKETNILIVALRFMTLVRTSMTLKFTF